MGYTRFFVNSDVDFSMDAIKEKLEMFKFRPLHPHGEDTETSGWCAYQSEYDHEKEILIKDFLYDDKIILSLRMDAISLPKQLLKSLVKKAVAQYVRDQGKLPSKMVRKELELAESKGLRARVLPKTKILEALWCQKTKELRVFTRSAKDIDRFLEIFQHTFLLRPDRRDFTFEAFQLCQKERYDINLEHLSHAPIFLPPLRIDVQ